MTRLELDRYITERNRLNEAINNLLDEKEKTMSSVCDCVQKLSDMPKGNQSCDKIQLAVETAIETDSEINFLIDELYGLKKDVEAFVSTLDELQAQIFFYRYIDEEWRCEYRKNWATRKLNCWSWGYISKRTGLSRGAVERIHKRILQHME